MYFGIAHLLDYPVDYDDMLFRFADFNAGHYASRNAAFQNAVSVLTKTPLALDGDLLLHGSAASEPSKTELAIRKLADQLDLSDAAIRRDLERGDQSDFADTRSTSGSSDWPTQAGGDLCRARSYRRSACEVRRSRASSPRNGSRNASTSATRSVCCGASPWRGLCKTSFVFPTRKLRSLVQARGRNIAFVS
jgi:hypothetical protein